VTRRVIVDTGPLVAFLDRREAHHDWIAEQAKTLNLPWLLCEAVLAESWHLLRGLPRAQDALLEMVEGDLLKVGFALADEIGPVRLLRQQYRDIPMSFADACLVRMAEKFADHAICTLDSDFTIYRKHRREVILLITPSGS
jgi:Predicted nucleic acid-binding protein, contains PIN domain